MYKFVAVGAGASRVRYIVNALEEFDISNTIAINRSDLGQNSGVYFLRGKNGKNILVKLTANAQEEKDATDLLLNIFQNGPMAVKTNVVHFNDPKFQQLVDQIQNTIQENQRDNKHRQFKDCLGILGTNAAFLLLEQINGTAITHLTTERWQEFVQKKLIDNIFIQIGRLYAFDLWIQNVDRFLKEGAANLGNIMITKDGTVFGIDQLIECRESDTILKKQVNINFETLLIQKFVCNAYFNRWMSKYLKDNLRHIAKKMKTGFNEGLQTILKLPEDQIPEDAGLSVQLTHTLNDPLKPQSNLVRRRKQLDRHLNSCCVIL